MIKKVILLVCVALLMLQVSCSGSDKNDGPNLIDFDSSEDSETTLDRVDDSDTDDVGTDNNSDTDSSTDEDEDSDSAIDIDSDSTIDTGEDHECTNSLDCDDDNPCTTDLCELDAFECIHLPKENGLNCDDGNYCNGQSTCQDGVCSDGTAPCSEVDDAGTPCIVEDGCDEELKTCVVTQAVNNTPCSDAMSCLGGLTLTCQSGICVSPAPGTYVDPCPTGDCIFQICVESTPATCDVIGIFEGDFCYDGEDCTEGMCDASGACIGADDPCERRFGTRDCIDVECSPEEDTDLDLPFTCSKDVALDNSICEGANGCFGADAYCIANPYGDDSTCFEGENRPCIQDDIGLAMQCIPTSETTQTCSEITPPISPIEVQCGVTFSLYHADFATREYYDYGGACADGDMRGNEVAVKLPDSFTEGSINVSAENISGDSDLTVLHLSDYQDPSSCTQKAFNDLAVTTMKSTDAIIIEAPPGYAPGYVELTIECL